LHLEREGASNFSASRNSIVNILILNTSDGSTTLNEIQGCVCVDISFLRRGRGSDLAGSRVRQSK
jgi:hypothetical protein